MTRHKHVPLRRCVVCGERAPKRGLVRLVRTPVGNVEVDPTGRKVGRGAYLCRTAACWQQALQRPGRLERALRMSIPGEERERLAQAVQSLGGE